MSIGQLGSSGEQFRDFLGGGQRDIGRGLQAILSAYNNPNGNLVRLDDRSQGLFQLTNTEYQTVFDRDAQNAFAETWYVEYRAVLTLRAEALKKKLNRAYTKVLENSMYAPLRPNEKWAPGANRDFNDIDADGPTKMFADGSGGEIGITGAPVIPTVTTEDTTQYVHEDWFSGAAASNKSTGQPYDDIRRYMAEQYLSGSNGGAGPEFYFDDIDGDGDRYFFNDPDAANTGDATYQAGGEGGANTAFYDLWAPASGFGAGAAYDLNTVDPSDLSTRFGKIARELNVPPSTDTRNFVATGNTSNHYYIQIPVGQNSKTASIHPLLPTSLGGTNGVFTQAERDAAVGAGVPAGNFAIETPASGPTPATYYLQAGTRFYDPNAIASQSLFSSVPVAAPGGGRTGPGALMNPELQGPPVQNGLPNSKTAQDVLYSGSGPGSAKLPAYKQGFVDSWYEARQVEKREAAVSAAVKAYEDGKSDIDAAGKKMSYNEIMDQVFSSIDQYGGAGSPPPPPGGGAPAGTPIGGNMIDNLVPYGYHYFKDGEPVKHPGANTDYGVGGNYKGKGNNSDGSLYTNIYTRLAAAADPTTLDGGGSGSDGINNNPASVPIGGPPTPPTPGARDYQTLGGSSNLYTPIPIGAAENADGTGQPDVRHPDGVDELTTTTKQVPGFITGVDDVSKLFVGRQWDYVPGHVPDSGENTSDGVGAVQYDFETISSHLNVIPGWFYDASGDSVGKALVTLPPPIDGLAWQGAASAFGLGRFDDRANALLGGPFFHVAGGANALGLGPDLDGSPTKYSIAVGFGMGIGGIYWGHTSAVGTIYKIERLMEHSGGGGAYAVDELGGKGGGTGFGFQAMKASLGAMAALGGANAEEMSVFPNVGLAGFHFDFNIPIPIPPPVGLSFLNIPMTTYGAVSYDVVTDYLGRFLQAMQHEVLDSVSAYSYATGGGYAMDSYGMRGEYQFMEKPAYETLEKLPDLFGFVDIGSMIDTAAGLVGLDDYTINNYDVKEDGLFGAVDGQSSTRHSFNASEQRELDTGAFFTTASFLSQFELNELDYTYWSSTNQNEEMANLDTLRMLSLIGKDLMKALNKALFGVAGRLEIDGVLPIITISVLNFMLQSFQEEVNEALMWDVLMRDQNEEGFVTSQEITNSSLTSEGYDFLEDERKLFAYDSEEIRTEGLLGQLQNFGMGSFELPNQVMNGTANTRRYKPYLTGPDGRAGRQGYGRNSPGSINPGDYVPDADPNTSDRVHAVTRHATDNSYYDDNWDIRVGFWQDTGLGDVNEVYVRKNKVSYGAVTDGIGDGNASGPVVTTEIDRYVGSHNRIVGRGYDGATPLDLQSFRTGYFSEKYFGYYIDEFDFGEGGGGDTTGVVDDAVTYELSGGIDNDPDRSGTITMHGGTKYYDRKNDYEFNLRTADNTAINLKSDQALAPVLGGAMKLTSVESNNPNQVLGASTQDVDNPLTKVLYDHMRIRSDGSNAQLLAEYRDAFNLGYLDDIFISASADAPTGGGVSSSIRMKFRTESFDAVASNAGSYEDRRHEEVVGSTNVTQADGTAVTQNLSTEPGYLGSRSYFKNVNRSITDIYLSSYFAFKRQPQTEAR